MQGRQATRRRKGIEVVHPREETTWCRKRSSLELQRWWKFPCGPWRINPVSISLRVWKRRNYTYIYRYRYIDIYRYRVSLVAQMVKNLPGMQEIWFDPWVRKIPWRRKWQPLQYPCLKSSMDRGAWRATVHGVAKESDTTEQLTHTPT